MRARSWILAVIVTSAMLAGVAASVKAETIGYPDPVGDATGSGHPAGDIYGVALDYEGSTVAIGVGVVDPEHPAEWLPSEVTGFSASLDVDLNGTVDYTAYYTYSGGSVTRPNANGATVCSAARGFQEDIYTLVFAASCIGSPPSLRAGLFFTNDFHSSADFAPSSGFGPVVRRTGGGGSTAPPPTAQSSQPSGAFDGIIRQPGTATAVGWAVDNDSPTAPVDIHLYVNGQSVAAGKADRPRNDVASARPGAGPNHGFAIPIPISGPGPHRVCAFAINIGGGPNPQLGCHTLTTAPFGSLDAVRESRTGLALSGWAIDPDTADSVDVHLYVNGSPAASATASGVREDVARAHPGYGSNHGFGISIPIASGTHNVCAYAIDKVHPHQNTSLGCRRISVSRNPFGSFDAAGRNGADLLISGWAADYEAEVTTVHVYANGSFFGQLVADQRRPDVAGAYPEAGERVGFSGSFAGVPAGAQVCVYALNAGPGSNTLLGCRNA